jgi:hypothetical protein
VRKKVEAFEIAAQKPGDEDHEKNAALGRQSRFQSET